MYRQLLIICVIVVAFGTSAALLATPFGFVIFSVFSGFVVVALPDLNPLAQLLVSFLVIVLCIGSVMGYCAHRYIRR